MNKYHVGIGVLVGLITTIVLSTLFVHVDADQLVTTSATAVPATDSETDTTYTVTVTPITAIPNGGKVELDFPSDFSTNFSSLTDADVSVSGTNITSTTESIDTGNYIITSTLTTSGDVTTEVTITIGDGGSSLNDITNPSSAGVYGINVHTYNGSSTVLDSGAAFVEIEDQNPVSANVTEAAVMTIGNTSIDLLVIPGFDNGQDKSQSTTLHVVSNAANGYVIRGRLDDGLGNAALRSSGGSILSSSYASATNNDNYFGYRGRNDGVGSSGNAEHGFASISTVLTADGSNPLGLGTTTSGQDHTMYYDVNVEYGTVSGDYSGTIYYMLQPSF